MSRIPRLPLVLPSLAFRDGDRNDDNAVAGWKHPNTAGGDQKGLIEKLDHDRSFGAIRCRLPALSTSILAP